MIFRSRGPGQAWAATCLMYAASTSSWQIHDLARRPAASANGMRSIVVQFITRSITPLIVRRQQLAAGRPIGFHRVVAGRVVAGRDHDAATAMLDSAR